MGGKGEISEGDEEVQTSGYKINHGRNAQHGGYSQ